MRRKVLFLRIILFLVGMVGVVNPSNADSECEKLKKAVITFLIKTDFANGKDCMLTADDVRLVNECYSPTNGPFFWFNTGTALGEITKEDAKIVRCEYRAESPKSIPLKIDGKKVTQEEFIEKTVKFTEAEAMEIGQSYIERQFGMSYLNKFDKPRISLIGRTGTPVYSCSWNMATKTDEISLGEEWIYLLINGLSGKVYQMHRRSTERSEMPSTRYSLSQSIDYIKDKFKDNKNLTILEKNITRFYEINGDERYLWRISYSYDGLPSRKAIFCCFADTGEEYDYVKEDENIDFMLNSARPVECDNE